MKKRDKIRSYISNFFEIFSSVLLFWLLFIVVLQVFFRNLTPITVPWTEELARYTGIWMVFMGVVALVAKKNHLKVTFILDRVPKKINSFLLLLAYLFTLLFSVITFLGAIKLVRQNWEQQAVAFPVTVAILYLAVGISSFFVLILLSLPIPIKLKGFFIQLKIGYSKLRGRMGSIKKKEV